MDMGYTVDYSAPVDTYDDDIADQVCICSGYVFFNFIWIDSKVDENYDPTEFFSGIGGGDHNGQANGNGHGAHPDPSDRLHDDLAVSDDSDDGGDDEEGVDPMAF